MVVAEARSWVGTQWQHQAAVKGVATDCIGLIGGIAVNLHIPGGTEWANDPSLKGYGRTPDPAMLIAACDKYLDSADRQELALADILIMRARGVSQPTHFAIVSQIDPPYIIHSRMLHRVAENRLSTQLEDLVLRVYRYRGVE